MAAATVGAGLFASLFFFLKATRASAVTTSAATTPPMIPPFAELEAAGAGVGEAVMLAMAAASEAIESEGVGVYRVTSAKLPPALTAATSEANCETSALALTAATAIFMVAAAPELGTLMDTSNLTPVARRRRADARTLSSLTLFTVVPTLLAQAERYANRMPALNVLMVTPVSVVGIFTAWLPVANVAAGVGAGVGACVPVAQAGWERVLAREPQHFVPMFTSDAFMLMPAAVSPGVDANSAHVTSVHFARLALARSEADTGRHSAAFCQSDAAIHIVLPSLKRTLSMLPQHPGPNTERKLLADCFSPAFS